MWRLAGCVVLLSTFLPPPERSSSALTCSRFRRWYSTSPNPYWQYPMIATRCDNDGCNAGNQPTNGCPMPGSWKAPSGIGWQGCVLNESLTEARFDDDDCLEDQCPWNEGVINGSSQKCEGDQDTCLLIIYQVEARGGRYLEQELSGEVVEGFCIKNGQEEFYCPQNQDQAALGDGDGDGDVGDTGELVTTRLLACKKFPQDDPEWTGMNCDPKCEVGELHPDRGPSEVVSSRDTKSGPGKYFRHPEVVCHIENTDGQSCKTPAPTPLPERHSKITATVRIDGYSMFCLLENYEAMMSSCAEEYPAPTFTELVQNSFLLAMKRRFRNSTDECATLRGRVWDDQRTAHCQSKPQPARRPPTGSLSIWLGGHWNPDLHIFPSPEQLQFPRQRKTEYDVELFKHHIRQGTIVDVQASYECYETRQGEYSLSTVHPEETEPPQRKCKKTGPCSEVYGADWPWEKRTRPWYKCQCTCEEKHDVKVVGGQFDIDGLSGDQLKLTASMTHVFDVSDASNKDYVLAFRNDMSSSAWGTAEGVTTVGTAGTAGAEVRLALPASGAPATFEYNCSVHASMDGEIELVPKTKQYDFAAPLSRGDNGKAFVEFSFEVHVSSEADAIIVRNSINNFEGAGQYGPTMTDEFRRQLIIDYFDQPADLDVTVIVPAEITYCAGSHGTEDVIEGYCIVDGINAVRRGAAMSPGISGALVLLVAAALGWQPQQLLGAQHSQGWWQ